MIVRQVTLLPQPDSPTMPSVLPFSTEKLDAVDRLDDPVVGPEVRLQIVDVEKRPSRVPRLRGLASRMRGSMTAYSRSTIRLKKTMQSVANTTTPWTVGRSKLSVALDREPPEAGEPEDRLGEDRAAEPDRDVHAEHRHDRQQRVAEHVARITSGSGAPLARAVRT